MYVGGMYGTRLPFEAAAGPAPRRVGQCCVETGIKGAMKIAGTRQCFPCGSTCEYCTRRHGDTVERW